MSDHRAAIAAIKQADSHDEIRAIVRSFSADALDPHGHSLLYSGQILEPPVASTDGIYGKQVAEAIARHTGANMLDDTPRGKLLLDKEVEKALFDRSKQLDMRSGFSEAEAKARAPDFLYGPATSANGDYSALRHSVWGEASHDYAASLRGHVTFVGVHAPTERIGAQVELPAAIPEGHAQSIGGHTSQALRDVQAKGGNAAVVEAVQQPFRAEVRNHGVYVAPDGAQVHVTREAAVSLGLPNAHAFTPAEELAAQGLHRGVAALPAEAAQLARGGSHFVHFALPAVAGVGAIGVASSVAEAHEAYDKAKQALAEHNQTGAVHVVRHYAATTLGGVLGGAAGGAATGAAWGAAGGAETGPGAVVTGLAGGVIGGVAGTTGALGVNRAIERYQQDHQTGADGVRYTYNDGAWTHRPWVGEPTAAPQSEVARLDHRRATQITERNLVDAKTPQDKLDAARSYADDYHQRGWDKVGKMPQSVSTVLDAHKQAAPAAQPSSPAPAAHPSVSNDRSYWSAQVAAGAALRQQDQAANQTAAPAVQQQNGSLRLG